MACCMATSKVGDHGQGGRPRAEQFLNKFDKHACDIKAIYKVDGLCEHAFQNAALQMPVNFQDYRQKGAIYVKPQG